MKTLFLLKNFSDGDEISEYVKSLSEGLVEEGHNATIVAHEDGSSYSVDERVEVERIPLHYEGDSLYSWVMMLNNKMKEKVRGLVEEEEFDLIHANDWITVPTATSIKNHIGTPFFLTVHSTENQRGFSDPNSSMISELEWQGCKEARKVLVNSEETSGSLQNDLDVPESKINCKNPLSGDWKSTILNLYEQELNIKKVDRS
jgi:hypothetical protein